MDIWGLISWLCIVIVGRYGGWRVVRLGGPTGRTSTTTHPLVEVCIFLLRMKEMREKSIPKWAQLGPTGAQLGPNWGPTGAHMEYAWVGSNQLRVAI